MSFTNPGLLWLLLLLPFVGLLYWGARASRLRRLRKFGDPERLQVLMPEASRYMPAVKLTLGLTVLGFMVIILARPRANDTLADAARQQESSRGIEAVVCFDVSNSMLASATDDPAGTSRLERSKQLFEQLLKKMRDDKVGLVVFAGEAYTQLPVTSDYVSAQMFMHNLAPSMVGTQGTDIDAAISMASSLFTPNSKVGKAIIIITDGEAFDGDATAAASRAARNGIMVDVVGVGTEKGAPIPLTQQKDRFFVDETGQTVMTALDATTAAEIAKAGGGVYVNANEPGALTTLDKSLDKLAKEEFMRTTVSPAAELFPLFTWMTLVLLMIYMFTVTRKISWLSRINFFTSKPTSDANKHEA